MVPDQFCPSDSPGTRADQHKQESFSLGVKPITPTELFLDREKKTPRIDLCRENISTIDMMYVKVCGKSK